MASTEAAGSVTPAAEPANHHVCVAFWVGRATRSATQTGVGGESAPGEHGLFELVHAFVGAAIECHPAELDEQRSGRGVDQIAAERDLHDRAVTLGDRDEPRRIRPSELMQADPIRRKHFAGCGTISTLGPPHTTTGVIT